MEKSAIISPCGTYRYTLGRTWDETKPLMCWVMLNPSRADADRDDQTITKCIGFAQRWGSGRFIVVNLFAFRTTYPHELFAARKKGVDVVGPGNSEAIRAALQQASYFLAAWGAHGGPTLEALNIAKILPPGTQTIEPTKAGHPSHPLMLSYALKPQDWSHPSL